MPNVTAAELKDYYGDNPSEQELATAFAVSSNQFCWVEDNEYDYEEGTVDWGYACAITDEWYDLMEFYQEKIFTILKNEGISIVSTGQIRILVPFMERNGYINAGGWWIRKQ
ncbi:MAG: hypothetical protein Q4D04_00035 [Clostridia bacterium]|nr:hypothetical protein [Clostridia bacterium]